MKQLLRGLLAVAVCLATAAASGTAATAAPAVNSFRVTTQKLVLTAQPGGGYFGVLTINATYTGSQPSVSSSVTLIQPANFSPTAFNGFGGCIIDNGYRCGATSTFVRGVPQTLSVGFIGFAAPADFARLATGGSIKLAVGEEPSGKRGTATFDGIMAAANGSVRNPRPYTPAPAPDMGFIASNIVAANGVLTIDVTVKDHNDAYNYGATIDTQVQGLQLSFINVSPPVMCMFPFCAVPGDTLYEGSVRTMQLTWGYSGAPGTYTGAVTLTPSNQIPGGGQADINPADNTLPITITIS